MLKIQSTPPLMILGEPGAGWCSTPPEGLCWGEGWWHSQERACCDFCLGGSAGSRTGPQGPPAGHSGEVPLLQHGAWPDAVDGWRQPTDWCSRQPQVNHLFCLERFRSTAPSIRLTLPSVVPGTCPLQDWSLPITRTLNQRLKPGPTALLRVLKWEILSSKIITMHQMRYNTPMLAT